MRNNAFLVYNPPQLLLQIERRLTTHQTISPAASEGQCQWIPNYTGRTIVTNPPFYWGLLIGSLCKEILRLGNSALSFSNTPKDPAQLAAKHLHKLRPRSHKVRQAHPSFITKMQLDPLCHYPQLNGDV